MNKNMNKNNFKLAFIIFAIVSFIVSCTNFTEPEEYSSIEISQLMNIQWELTSIETPTYNMNLDNYEPFIIVFMNTEIWGTDNCNYLRGDYSVRNDSLVISNWSTTEIGCYMLNIIPFDHLFCISKIMLRGKQLVIIQNDTTYVYSSNFTERIPQITFLDTTLSLINSNDSNITFYDSLGYYPKLILSSKREFNIRWYNKLPENTGFINQYSGIFGINNKKEILFTSIGSSYEGNGVSIDDLQLIKRLIDSDKYEYDGTTLRLINSITHTYYDFIINRS